jgi:type IV secretion system protein VirD4
VERAPSRRDLGRLIVKIILGGASNSRDLQDLSTLIGERDEYTDS